MSLCSVVMDKDNIFMCADTAVSSKLNNVFIRTSNDGQKIFSINGNTIFCSGKMENVNKVIEHITKYSLINLDEYLRNNFMNTHEKEFEVELLVYDGNAVLQYSQYNNYECVIYNKPQNGIQILCAGLKTRKCKEVLKKHLLYSNGNIYDVFAKTYNEMICNEIGGNVIVYNGNGNCTVLPLRDSTFVFGQNLMQQALVSAETLVGEIIIGKQLSIRDETGVLEIVGNLLSIYDNKGNVKIELGEYEDGAYGLKIYGENGDILLDRNGLLQSWQDTVCDSLDSSKPFKMYVYMPKQVNVIKTALLRFSLLPFRAYSKGAKSYEIPLTTTLSKKFEAKSTTSDKEIVKTSTALGGECIFNTVTCGTADSWKDSQENGHDHGIPHGVKLAVYGGQVAVEDAYGDIEYVVGRDEEKAFYYWKETGDHEHAIEIEQQPHTHDIKIELEGHSHKFTVPEHSHSIDMPAHEHDINYGIYEDTSPLNVKITINDKTLSGTYNSNKSDLDISSYLTTGAWNEIKFASDRLGRISATVFVQALMSTD